MNVDPTALIHPSIRLPEDVRIGPYAVVEAEVEIGAGCAIGAHAVIKRFTVLGRRNRIAEHAIIGGEPQDVKFKDERTGLRIGDDNLIREFCTFHRACGEGDITEIGSRNFFMVGVHVAHNCRIGDDNTFANEVALAGHVSIEDHVFLSNNVGVHQFVRFGRYAMVGGKSKIVKDVLPFFITDGNPARVRGLNTVGLRRAGFTLEERTSLRRAYKILFRSQLPMSEAMSRLEEMNDPNVSHLLSFMRGTQRGFTSARGKLGEDNDEE